MQAVPNFGEQSASDDCFVLLELQVVEPSDEVAHRHAYHFGDGLAANLDIFGLLLQSGAMTNRAECLATIAGLHDTILDLVEVLGHHLEEVVDAIQRLAFLPTGYFADSIFACRFFAFLTRHYTCRITTPKQILLLLCQLVIRPVYRE